MSALPLTARRAKVGDRMLVTLLTVPPGGGGQLVSTVVKVNAVTRLGCGCDRAEADRPDSAGGPCPVVHLLPASCAHHGGHLGDGIDFDEARERAS